MIRVCVGTGIGDGQASDSLATFTNETETGTLVTAMAAAGSTPNVRRQYTLNRMIKRLKDGGVWAKLTHLWIPQDTAALSLINIRNPGTNNLTSNGSPTFTANVGWAFPLITDFLDSGVALNSLTHTNVSMGLNYAIASASAAAASFDMGAQSTGSALYLKAAVTTRAAVAAAFGANQSPLISSTFWDNTMFASVSRAASTDFQAYHGGVGMGTVTDTSTAPSAATTITIGKVNGQATTCRSTLGAAFLGQALTATEMAMLNAAVQTAIDSIRYGDVETYEPAYLPASASADVVVYGTTLAGCIAAYRLAQLGRSVILVGGWRDRSFGGMTANGLGFIDFDVEAGVGGLAYDVVKNARNIDGQATTHTSGVGTSDLRVQSRNVQLILRGLIDGARAGGATVPVYWSSGVASVQKTGTRVTSITTVDGRTFTGTYFIDTSEELDLAYMAGCTTTLGREAAGSGSEQYGGYTGTSTLGSVRNQTQIENATPARLSANDAYNTIGVSGSGLIPGIEADPGTTIGAADSSIMAYTYRLTWNSNVGRRVPFGAVAPIGYSAANYELLGRLMTAYPTMTLNTVLKQSTLTGSTAWDINNQGGISLNHISSGRDYTACESAGTRAQVYAAREAVVKTVEAWARGFIHFILNSGDSRIPAGVVTSLQGFGWDFRHYLDPHPNDSLYWPGRLYIREHRRLVGDFILNGTDFTATDGTTPRSVKTISTSSYRMDSHIHRRFVDTGSSTIWCEGSVALSQAASGGTANGTDGITPLPYEAYLPKVAEITNLGVTFGVSCTHIAMTAARMELPTAQAGESLAYAINIAMSNSNQNLQVVDYPTLRTAILAAPTTYAPVLPQVN